MMIRRIDQNIDLAADLAGKLLHGAAVCHIERNDGRLRQSAQRLQSRDLLPRLSFADPDLVGARLCQRVRDRLPDRRLSIGHQDLATARVARELTQLWILGQIRSPLFGHRDERRLPGAIERRLDAHAARRRADAGMQIGNEIDAGVQANKADAPGQSFAEVEFLRGAQGRLGEKLALPVLRPPDQPV